MTDKILYNEDVNLEDLVKDMNFLIEDVQFLNKLTEVTLQKRTRLQVKDLISVLTREEIEEVSNKIYDEAVLDSGIRNIEHNQDMKEFYENLYDYEHRDESDR